MKNTLALRMMLLISVMSLTGRSLAIADSTTDNQLPSMREGWQKPSPRANEHQDIHEHMREHMREEHGEVDPNSDADYKSNVTNKEDSDYKDEYSDIEEMLSGGDYVGGWVS